MRPRLPFLWILLLMCFRLPYATAAGFTSIRLYATRTAILADGKQSTTLRAEVRDSSGRFVGENTAVQFQTTAGTLSSSQSFTHGGIATVTLTSAPIAGVARVIAFGSGGASPPLEILFTDDPEETFQGNNYMLFSASGYLAYSATDKAIEAIGKNGGAKLGYRNIEITADRMQMGCENMIVRARDNVVVKRAGHILKATRLYYSLVSGEGYASAEVDGKLETVTIIGDNLRTELSKTPIPGSYLNLPELQVHLNIVARSITYFPNERLQFRRPRFFQDQVQILSLPYYELGLYSTELFSDQFISVGTSGLGLELPFYYNLTPRSSGIVYLRHQQPLGRGYYSTQPGWAIDVIQGYSSQGEKRYEGAYGFTGLTRNDWGFRWNHNQEFSPTAQGTFDLEFPAHDSIFSSASFSHQLKTFRWGTNFSGGQTFTSDSTTSMAGDAFAETLPHNFIGSKAYQYTVGATVRTGQTHTADSTIANYRETTEGVNMRVFTRPIVLDPRTTFTNSFSIGHTWSDTGGTGIAALATLALDRSFGAGGALNLTYDFVDQPSSVFSTNGRHRISAVYSLQGKRRMQAQVFGSAFLDSPEASVLADLSYKLDSRWRLITAVTLQRFESETYNDFEFVLGRRIGARELQLTYSTHYKRFSFDFTATRF